MVLCGGAAGAGPWCTTLLAILLPSLLATLTLTRTFSRQLGPHPALPSSASLCPQHGGLVPRLSAAGGSPARVVQAPRRKLLVSLGPGLSAASFCARRVWHKHVQRALSTPLLSLPCVPPAASLASHPSHSPPPALQPRLVLCTAERRDAPALGVCRVLGVDTHGEPALVPGRTANEPTPLPRVCWWLFRMGRTDSGTVLRTVNSRPHPCRPSIHPILRAQIYFCVGFVTSVRLLAFWAITFAIGEPLHEGLLATLGQLLHAMLHVMARPACCRPRAEVRA